MFKTLAVLAMLGAIQSAHAAAPSGFYRTSVGAFDVVALADGVGSLPAAMLIGGSAQASAEVTALLEDDVIAGPMMPMPVNAFLVKTADKLILVDTGTGRNFGPPELGHVIENLRAAGYAPSQVDLVLITHMHPDHLGGLVSASGEALFPRAIVRMAQADSDFWLSETNAATAPKQAKPLFDVARKSAAPYLRTGHWRPFAEGETIVPALTSVPLPGHTPGHTGYRFTSNGQQLLMWGDVVHSVPVQMARPGVAFALDLDPVAAVSERKRLFAELAANQQLVAGAHLPFPGVGRVRSAGITYRWAPAPY